MKALLSVSNKEGLVPFAAGLKQLGYELLSTGGTLEALRAAGIPATKVSDYTGSPEILGGRVKTLHPKIHGGILGRVALASDLAEMKANGIAPISIVAVNLYPFRETVEKGASREETIEQIDIGGPAMVRASAKNAESVTIVVDPTDYAMILAELQERQSVSVATRRRLQKKAFEHTAAYDAAISSWFADQENEVFANELTISVQKVQTLRYGENPHQRGAFYRNSRLHGGPSIGVRLGGNY